MSDAIKCTLVNGEPVCCENDCPSWRGQHRDGNPPCTLGSNSRRGEPCVPGLREQRERLKAELAEMREARNEAFRSAFRHTKNETRILNDDIARAERIEQLEKHTVRQFGDIKVAHFGEDKRGLQQLTHEALKLVALELNVEPSEDDEETRRHCLEALRGGR